MSYKDFEIVFYNIEYDVGSEDLELNDLHNSLPTEVTTKIRIDDDYLDNYLEDNKSIFDVNDYESWFDYDLADELSNETGWCICDFDYIFPHIESDFIRFKGDTRHALDEFMTEEKECA